MTDAVEQPRCSDTVIAYAGCWNVIKSPRERLSKMLTYSFKLSFIHYPCSDILIKRLIYLLS